MAKILSFVIMLILYENFMRKKNVILPLFLGSLFVPITLDAAIFDSYKSYNNQISDPLIASKPRTPEDIKKEKELKEKRKQEFLRRKENEKLRKRQEEQLNNIDQISNINEMSEEEVKDDDEVNNETLFTELKKLLTPKVVSILNDVKIDIEQMPDLFIENETAPYTLKPFFRCGILTEKALKAEENGNLKKADTYAKLAIKSVVREKNILEKQVRQIKEKSIDPKFLENIEYSLLGINSIILDDYKSGNRYMKKALESENQNTSNLKSLIAYTEIINGEIDQGCSDLEDLIIDGTIDLVDLDIIPIEDICRIIK